MDTRARAGRPAEEAPTHDGGHTVRWHDVPDPAGRSLDELAAMYSLHSLHVEDCRHPGQRVKVESSDAYLFVVVKLATLDENSNLRVGNLGLFLGAEFLITVHSVPTPVLERLHDSREELRADQVLHRVLDRVVESYLPLIDELEDRIERLHDAVVGLPRPDVLDSIGRVRGTLMHLRRVLSAMRHVTFQLRHMASPLISRELLPFLRDVHDDLGSDLDTIAAERERLNGALDIYLSSVANRTTEATRTLTLMGTVALPALVITGIFGMNVSYPAWTRAPWALGALVGITIAITVFLLWYLRRNDYLPGGSTSRRSASTAGSGESRHTQAY